MPIHTLVTFYYVRVLYIFIEKINISSPKKIHIYIYIYSAIYLGLPDRVLYMLPEMYLSCDHKLSMAY